MSNTSLELTNLENDIALAPANGRAYTIITQDGVNLRMGVWEHDTTSKGTIFILPGRADFIEKFGHAISEFFDAGYTVCAIEFRGLGLSDRLTADRRAGYIARFTNYQHDVHAMVQTATTLNLPKPWNLVGNSMGGTVGLRAVMEENHFTSCAFTSPMWGVKLSKFEHMIAPPITGAIRALGLGHFYAPGKNGKNETLETSFEDNEITGDEQMFAHLQSVNRALDDRWIGGPTVGWLQQALHETKFLSTQPSPSIKCIAFSAEEDALVNIDSIKSRMDRWQDGEHVFIPKARHDLLREGTAIRGKVIGSILGFFNPS